MCEMCKKKNALYNDIQSKADDLFKDSVKIVMLKGEASVSFLQRCLTIGYSRAAKIIDKMEECGYISPYQDDRKRKVLITPGQFRKDFNEEYNS